MDGLKEATEELNNGLLKRLDLELFQYYDETDYIRSSIQLVQQNIFVGGALTFIVLLLFLHLGRRSLIVIPFIAASCSRFGLRFSLVVPGHDGADARRRSVVRTGCVGRRAGDSGQRDRNVLDDESDGAIVERDQFGRIGFCGRNVGRQRGRRAGKHFSSSTTWANRP